MLIYSQHVQLDKTNKPLYNSAVINPPYMRIIMFSFYWNCFSELLIQLYGHYGGSNLWCWKSQLHCRLHSCVFLFGWNNMNTCQYHNAAQQHHKVQPPKLTFKLNQHLFSVVLPSYHLNRGYEIAVNLLMLKGGFCAGPLSADCILYCLLNWRLVPPTNAAGWQWLFAPCLWERN